MLASASDIEDIIRLAEVIHPAFPESHHRIGDADMPQLDVLDLLARIVGKPPIASEPIAAPVTAAPALRTARLEMSLGRSFFFRLRGLAVPIYWWSSLGDLNDNERFGFCRSDVRD
jgi:hypothetical protein